jgi:hypothetical protein
LSPSIHTPLNVQKAMNIKRRTFFDSFRIFFCHLNEHDLHAVDGSLITSKFNDESRKNEKEIFQ